MNGRNNHSTNQNKGDASKTAKPVIAVKWVTAQPTFWKEKGYGDREKPLTHNEIAAIFLTSEDVTKANTRPDIKQIKTVSTRERWINKLYEKYIKEHHYKQIVILGSGFDIRPCKKNTDHQKNKKHADLYASVTFWEIDRAEILDEKESIYKAHGYDKNALYLRADYTKDNFIETLTVTGLDVEQPILIIWEGNSMYLEKAQILDVLSKLTLSFKEFTIAFDYFKQITIDSLPDDSPLKTLWKTGIDDIYELASQIGLSVSENRNIAELEMEYKVDYQPSERARQYSICSLRK